MLNANRAVALVLSALFLWAMPGVELDSLRGWVLAMAPPLAALAWYRCGKSDAQVTQDRSPPSEAPGAPVS